ncbi:MAG: SH3 domain-containing protein, partial [Candidatus Limnocylindria bacterium]
PTDLAAGGYAEVIADGVRVRIAPSATATVIGALFTGDVVRILAPAQVAEGIAWYRVETVVVQHGDAMTGYVAAGVEGQPFLRPTSAPPPPTPSPSVTPSPTP